LPVRARVGNVKHNASALIESTPAWHNRDLVKLPVHGNQQ
jgi:hypothetical protein